jgi:photosystem II stability/assembly factor-like uncharacterized protein
VSPYGVLRSDDAGQNWKEVHLNTPPGAVNIYSFEVNPSNEQELYYTATVLGENGEHVRSTFYKSTNGGVSWATRKLPTASIPVSSYINPKTGMLFLGFTNAAK